MTLWTKEEVDRLNRHQNSGCFHPYTCGGDGDTAHIAYEFSKLEYNGTLEEYIEAGYKKGYSNPIGALTETKLVATEEGWVCPVCQYHQQSVIEELLSPEFEKLFLENERFMERAVRKAKRKTKTDV